jgi:hypothetical protein
MSTYHPNPSGLRGSSESSSQGDHNGRGFPQPPDKEISTKDKNKNKNKNMSISSYFAIAPANKEVFRPSDTPPANPVLATAVPATTTANADTSMTDEDDATIASSNTSSFNDISSNHPKESVIKLEFLFQDPQHPQSMALRAGEILHAMYTHFYNNLVIYNNHGRQVRDFTLSNDHLLQEFNLHSKFFSKSVKKHRYSLIFRIRSSVPLSNIRKFPEVVHELQKHSAVLVSHPWKEDVTDIVSLGWFLGPLPKYTTSEEMTIKMTNRLAFLAKVPVKKIPKFHCQMDNISATDTNNRRIACRAYSLSAQRHHSEPLIKIISAAYRASSDPEDLFIFHRQRYQSPRSFENAIRKQNEIEATKRVVAVKGLHPAYMFRFSEVLTANYPAIEDIFSTPKTSELNPVGKPIGRYNLLCTKENFVDLATKLSAELAEIYQEYLIKSDIETSALDETVEVVSRFPGKRGLRQEDEFSGTTIKSRDSLISNCVSVLEALEFPAAMDEELFPAPTYPTGNHDSQSTSHTQDTTTQPPRPTYASVATSSPQNVIPPPRPTNSVSRPAPDPLITKLCDTIEQLQLQNQQLQLRMEQLQAALNAQQTQDNLPVPAPPPPPNLYAQVTASAPDPANNQEASALSLLMARMDAMQEFLQAQSREMAAIREHQLSQPSLPMSSPPRKRINQDETSMTLLPSPHPDGTPIPGEMQGDDRSDVSL